MSDVHITSPSQWTDVWRPTCPATISAREAAVLFLAELEWEYIAEDFDADPLVYHGTVSWLDDTPHSKRTTNTLIAWMTAHLRLAHWCVNDRHTDEDWHPSNYCWGDDGGDGPCEWERIWYIDAHPDEFWRFVQQIARRPGW